MRSFSSYAIVPAAGRSRRMGSDKLMLAVAGRPLIDSTLRAWTNSAADHVVVVVRGEDQPLRDRCRLAGVEVAAAGADPAEMRDSLEIGLRYVAERFAPEPNDAWLVAPADMPGLGPTAIDLVLAQYDARCPRVIVPRVAGKRGHPVLLPWSAAAAFTRSPPHEGLDAFVRRSRALEVPLAGPGAVLDIDTPADYRRLVSGGGD
ncbi:molybdopterin-guanine dinucleotide biosynthesis protein MobA [Pirellulimonas nuda]|uniref:Molybdopterin-guanine dinucleotide biosynthesis protein MobA n=1 Tax=Pirellulimonas nuda TaxID=2528009 RepID=A0A518DCU1_9BACT|nr:nucleotidyltransferase family protein [Pirellulimonas nuda]QDU89297.1 molybdopterin-guanine dinucleotide biosynthesis protein MobA [Pirellulimonas nuda]